MFYVWNTNSWQGGYPRESDAIAIAAEIGGTYGLTVPQNIKNAQTARLAQEKQKKIDRAQMIVDNISGKTKNQIDNAIDGIDNLASAKTMMKKMARAIWALSKLQV